MAQDGPENKSNTPSLYEQFSEFLNPEVQKMMLNAVSGETYFELFQKAANSVLKRLNLLTPTAGLTSDENQIDPIKIIAANGSKDSSVMNQIEANVQETNAFNKYLQTKPPTNPENREEHLRTQHLAILEANKMFDALLQENDFKLDTLSINERAAFTSHMLSKPEDQRATLAKLLVNRDLKTLEGLNPIDAILAGFDRETQMEDLEVPANIAAGVDGVMSSDPREPDDSQYVKSELNKAVQKRLQGPREPNEIRELKIEQEKALSPNLSKASEDLKDQALQIQSVASGNPIDFIYQNKLYNLDETNVEHQKTIRAMFDTFVPGFIKNNKELTTGKAAWCAVFVAHVLKNLHGDAFENLVHTRSASGGKKDSYNRIRAKHYGSLGNKVSLNKARKGDLVIKEKNGQWHVGFFVEAKNGTVAILGGNQDNEVNITFYDESEIKFIRRLDGSVDIGSENVKRIEEDIAATSSKSSTSKSTR
jgi:hypothetical protein